jgi:hypothetical protein
MQVCTCVCVCMCVHVGTWYAYVYVCDDHKSLMIFIWSCWPENDRLSFASDVSVICDAPLLGQWIFEPTVSQSFVYVKLLPVFSNLR